MNNFCRAPAAMTFHHAYIGGLLEHTLNAMEVADAVCKFYPKLNRDLVVAGIFLHDIAKTWELSYDCSFGYTDGGQLVGHIVKSAMWLEDKAKAAALMLGEPIPRVMIDVLQHIILSHHGEPEFGAARIPSTPEAIAVHVIENFDAKMMMALSLTRGESANSAEGGSWTEYLKAFNGRLYRPDVAPAEAEMPHEQIADETGAADGNSDQRHSDQRPSDPPPVSLVMPIKPAAASPAQTGPVKIAITNPLFESAPSRKR
jgi:3'-5' exoribonuclease